MVLVVAVVLVFEVLEFSGACVVGVVGAGGGQDDAFGAVKLESVVAVGGEVTLDVIGDHLPGAGFVVCVAHEPNASGASGHRRRGTNRCVRSAPPGNATGTAREWSVATIGRGPVEAATNSAP